MKKSKVMIVQELGYEEIASQGIEKLEKENFELLSSRNPDQSLNVEGFKECEAILVRGAKINRQIIENAPNLKVIARCGVGTDNIDIQAASENDVVVCNVPDANYTSVAEHVMGLIVALSHQIVKADKALRKGNFNARHQYMGSELKGKKVGIVGYGRIGQLVANKCVNGMEMTALVYDPYANQMEVEKNIEFVDTLDEILTESDFITLHLPYLPALHHFIDQKAFEKMKASAYLLNCARGGLVDEVALAEAVKNGVIAGAGIDVFEEEPPRKDNHLWDLENVIVTPHMAASTRESLVSMAVGAAEEIIRVLNGKEPKNCINKQSNEDKVTL